MKKIKNLLLVIFLLLMGGLVLTKSAQAFWPFDLLKKNQNQAGQTQTTFPSIIQKLIDKFGLNPDEVNQVLEEERAEREQQRQARFEERLGQMVEEGQITEEQKQAMLNKKAEMQEERGQHQEEMRKWAEENGIDWQPSGLGLGKGFRHW